MSDVAVPVGHDAAPGGPPGSGAGGQARPRAIVPLAGLPLAVLALGSLVAAVAANRLWALEFFHVVGGGLWTGIDLFLGFVLGPIMAQLSIPARMELSRRLMPPMLLIMPTLVSVIALGILEPAKLAVLFALRAPEPDGRVIGTLMRRFIYTAGITGAMQVATLVIMSRLAAG